MRIVKMAMKPKMKRKNSDLLSELDKCHNKDD